MTSRPQAPNTRRRPLLLLLAGCTIVAVITCTSCKEKFVPVISHRDEIAGLLSDPYEGGTLFRTDHLINPDPYLIPGDTAHYRDSVIEQQRHVTVLISAKPADHGHLGLLSEAVASVTDSFAIERKRSGVVVDTSQVKFVRYGFLLRFGTDTDPYLGWKLWGFNGIGSTDPSIVLHMADSRGTSLQFDRSFYNESPESLKTSLPNNLKFVLLNDIHGIVPGSKVSLEQPQTSEGAASSYFLYSAETNAGFKTRNLAPLPQYNHFVDTFQIVSTMTYTYNIIYVQLHLNDGSRRILRGWVVPYRKPLGVTAAVTDDVRPLPRTP